MKRTIEKYLKDWAVSDNRKVLLLRGARQVGKTWSARHLGEQFEYFLEVNFEFDREVHLFFEQSLSPDDLCRNLSIYYKVPIIDGKTLVFFDEIQSCIPAISSLRFFYEKRPELHVLAAGSLLEFAMEELPSYGVGRIESLWMYPMSFIEFLTAGGEGNLVRIIETGSPEKPVNKVFHERLIGLLRQFMLLGGLPEVIQTFFNTNDFAACLRIIDQLSEGLKDDFSKYKKSVPVSRLRPIFESVAHQTGNKFNLAKALPEANHAQIKEAIILLEKAGLIYQIKHTAVSGLPLGASSDPKKFRLLLFDHGILQRILGLNPSDLLVSNNFSNIFRGSFAELFAGLELIKNGNPFVRPQLYYWQRDKRGSQAEVDYILQIQNEIVPLEIKSGRQGKMQSLRLFLSEKNIKIGYRVSMENFGEYENIAVIPLYGLSYFSKKK